MASRKGVGGRDTKYKPEYAEQVFKLCLLGADDKRIANFFEVAVSTVNKWKKDFPEFSESIKDGKSRADAEIARSMYHRAKGYSHPEDKIFNDGGEPLIVPTIKHYPPDTAAGIFWLKNRQGWKDRIDQNVNSKNENINLNADVELSQAEALLREAGIDPDSIK